MELIKRPDTNPNQVHAIQEQITDITFHFVYQFLNPFKYTHHVTVF